MGIKAILLEKVLDDVIDQRSKEMLPETSGNDESFDRYENHMRQLGLVSVNISMFYPHRPLDGVLNHFAER